MKKAKVSFIVLFLVVSLIPLVLMPWLGNQEAESADADVSIAPAFAAGKFNKDFLESAGDYFSKKFALRRELVTAGNLIKAKVFGVSGQSGVVVGRDGYLFYKDSFDDFLGRDALSDYEIHSMAHNISLMRDELDARGIAFLFTVAPNKNSLYPELMPGKYRPDVASRNIKRLRPLLRENGVRYLNLYKLFNDINEVMYLKGDSHWNNTGAALVTGEIVNALERRRYAYDDGHSEERKDFSGDLYAMIYPSAGFKDNQVYYDKMAPDLYNKRVEIRTIDDETGEMKEVDPAKDPDWPKSSEIETVSLGEAEGSLLMIRDSFGNSLTPFMSEEFSEALFLNGTPYDIGRATTEEYDTVVFETVERNLSRLISDAPVLSTSDLGVPEDQKEILPELAQGISRYTGTILMEPSDSEFDYTYVSGTLDPAETDDGTKPYLLMKNAETGDSEFHALFRTTTHDDDGRSNRYGVAAYIRSDIIESGEYDLFIAYETDGSWNVSGKLGEYIKEDF